jgi:hypothetical protein
LKLGMNVSMRMHHILFKEVSTILTHRLIRLGKSFRYVILRNGSDLNWLLSPSTLRRLCQLLVESTKVRLSALRLRIHSF